MTGGRKWAAGRKDGLTDGRKSVRGGLVKSEVVFGVYKSVIISVELWLFMWLFMTSHFSKNFFLTIGHEP